jgi:hypothetical protein
VGLGGEEVDDEVVADVVAGAHEVQEVLVGGDEYVEDGGGTVQDGLHVGAVVGEGELSAGGAENQLGGIGGDGVGPEGVDHALGVEAVQVTDDLCGVDAGPVGLRPRSWDSP